MLTHVCRIVLGHQFKPFVLRKAPDYLPDLDVPGLGVYVHVPFCKSLCPFCPYYKTQYDESVHAGYCDALLREMQIVAERAFPQRRAITSVYFGGGSPALLAGDLARIRKSMDGHFKLAGHAGIELHPRDVVSDTPTMLSDAGFDMVSIGVQSFSPRLLGALGRSDESPSAALSAFAGGRFQAVDVDLIFGIPGQREQDLRSDFLTAAEGGATQISTYPFIDFSFASNRHKPLGWRRKKGLLACLLKTADEGGFVRSSVWTFGKRGSPQYSSITRDNFLGFGPSAVSLGKDALKVNVFSVDAYVETVRKGFVPTALRMDMRARARGLYWLFWSCYNGAVSERVYGELFGRSLGGDFGGALFVGTTLGWVRRTDDGWSLTERGSYLFHLVEQAYTHQYIDKTWRCSMETPWPERIRLY